MSKITGFILAGLVALGVPSVAGAREWPLWGNGRIADCAFAAAADWELGALGHLADEAQVEEQFFAAGGSATEGISAPSFERWWATHGIGGVRATLRQPHNQNLWSANGHSRDQLIRLIHRAHFLLATLSWDFGHEVLVTGADASGVRITTWGSESTVTWEGWYEAVVATYIVTVRH